MWKSVDKERPSKYLVSLDMYLLIHYHLEARDMAGKIKVTMDQIVECAFAITQKEGIAAVTARRIGKELKCSLQPVYYDFGTITRLKDAVIKRANETYNDYIASSKKATEYPPYKAVGVYYIRFAIEEPELFKLLFMRDTSLTEKDADKVDDNEDYIIAEIGKRTGLDPKRAKKFHFEMWIFTHGIATMIATRYMRFKPEEISQLLDDAFRGLLKEYKEQQTCLK